MSPPLPQLRRRTRSAGDRFLSAAHVNRLHIYQSTIAHSMDSAATLRHTSLLGARGPGKEDAIRGWRMSLHRRLAAFG